LLQLYYSIFHCHLQYGIIIWGSTFKTYLSKLEKLQNKAVKVIGGASWQDRATPYYSKLQILKICDLFQLELASFMYKFKNKQLPFTFLHYFQETSTICSKQLRSTTNQNYFLPRYRTKKIQRSIKFQGAKIWNSINAEIRKSSSIKMFKKKYKLYLLSHYIA